MHHKHKHKTTCWGMRWHGQCYCIRNCWNLSEPCHRRCFQGAVNHVGKSSAGERVGVWKDTMLGFVEDTNIWKSAFKVTVLAKKRFIDFQYSWSRWSVNGQDTTSMYFYTEGIGPIKRCHFMLSDRMPMLARWCCRGPPWWHTDSALRWGKAVFHRKTLKLMMVWSGRSFFAFWLRSSFQGGWTFSFQFLGECKLWECLGC